MGAGSSDLQKHEDMFIIEDKLPFFREMYTAACPIELLSIDKDFNNGTSFRVCVAINPKG